jgi:hypothetical protein
VGTLQFFDAMQDRHVYDVQVVDRNYISRTDTQPIPGVAIDFFAITTDAKWLVVAESRKELSGERVSCLKFWSRDLGSSRHTLHTIVDPPHLAAVTALSVGTSLVATVAGAQFKVWSLSDAAQWTCLFVGNYQGLPACTAALSYDESLLAVAFSQQVSVWLPSAGELVRALPHSQNVTLISFVANQPHLIAASPKQLSVWDLVSFQGTLYMPGIYPFSSCEQ